MIYVGTHTFRHEDGSNNFVQRGKPLGWQYGSDARQYLIGLKYFNSHNLICRMDIGFRESGSNSIIDTPYAPYRDYNKISFPSGLVNEEIFINAEFQIWMKKYASFYSQLQYTNSNILNNDYVFTIGFDIYYLKHFKL